MKTLIILSVGLVLVGCFAVQPVSTPNPEDATASAALVEADAEQAVDQAKSLSVGAPDLIEGEVAAGRLKDSLATLAIKAGLNGFEYLAQKSGREVHYNVKYPYPVSGVGVVELFENALISYPLRSVISSKDNVISIYHISQIHVHGGETM